MAIEIPNTFLAEALSSTATTMKVVSGYADICALVREPGHIIMSVGAEKVLVTGCQGGGRLSIIRGAERSCPRDWPVDTTVCYVKAITESPDFTACAEKREPTCGCKTCGD